MSGKIGFLGFGLFFGFVLSRVGASEFDLIYGMFIGQNLKLAWVIIIAIIVAHFGMRYLKSLDEKKQTKDGLPLAVSHKKLGPWSLLGGALFGIGWGITGACPGTVLAQIGEGKILGLFTLFGMLCGTYLYAVLKEKTENI